MTPQDVYEILRGAASDSVFCGTTRHHSCLLPKLTRYRSTPPLTDSGVYASSSAELAMIEAVINTRGWQWSCTDATTGAFEVSIPRTSLHFLIDGFVNVLPKKPFGEKAPLLFYSATPVVPRYALKLDGSGMKAFLKKRGIKFHIC